MIWRLSPDFPDLFPDPSEADPSGLLAIGGDLSPVRLKAAYARGIFPWYDAHSPILWWSPDPRCVIFPETFHLPRRLKRTLRQKNFRISVDEAFSAVIHRCAAIPRLMPDGSHAGTWLVPDMISAYTALHQLGLAHSIEAWDGEGLAGGLYGVRLGGVFFGESMFHERPDASKAALSGLMEQLRTWGVGLLDCQMTTPHLARFGAVEIPRAEFLAHLTRYLDR